jgi:large subunit ribosomal protein L19
MISKALAKIQAGSVKAEPASFRIGDTVRVHMKVKEGDKERVQVYSGTVIARKGRGATETFSVRRISQGVGVEKVFPLHSPNVVQVEVEASGRARRAKLYFLRERVGKKTKLREKA